jgi:hypothetical protein
VHGDDVFRYSGGIHDPRRIQYVLECFHPCLHAARLARQLGEQMLKLHVIVFGQRYSDVRHFY